jgi:hypothetical protein
MPPAPVTTRSPRSGLVLGALVTLAALVATGLYFMAILPTIIVFLLIWPTGLLSFCYASAATAPARTKQAIRRAALYFGMWLTLTAIFVGAVLLARHQFRVVGGY